MDISSSTSSSSSSSFNLLSYFPPSLTPWGEEDLYNLLGISISNPQQLPDFKALSTAYRHRIRILHPDKRSNLLASAAATASSSSTSSSSSLSPSLLNHYADQLLHRLTTLWKSLSSSSSSSSSSTTSLSYDEYQQKYRAWKTRQLRESTLDEKRRALKSKLEEKEREAQEMSSAGIASNAADFNMKRSRKQQRDVEVGEEAWYEDAPTDDVQYKRKKTLQFLSRLSERLHSSSSISSTVNSSSTIKQSQAWWAENNENGKKNSQKDRIEDWDPEWIFSKNFSEEQQRKRFDEFERTLKEKLFANNKNPTRGSSHIKDGTKENLASRNNSTINNDAMQVETIE